jgi:hypothetical protein
MSFKAKPKPKEEPIEMEPSQPDTGTRATYSGKVYYVKRINYLLSQAFEATIKDGILYDEKAISIEDMPSTTIGSASSALWGQLRGDR